MLPPLISPFVLMADIDKAVMEVTTVVERIKRTPWPARKKPKVSINHFICRVSKVQCFLIVC